MNDRNKEATYCERCGKPGARAIGDRVLCTDCYFACNSCCPEFEDNA